MLMDVISNIHDYPAFQFNETIGRVRELQKIVNSRQSLISSNPGYNVFRPSNSFSELLNVLTQLSFDFSEFTRNSDSSGNISGKVSYVYKINLYEMFATNLAMKQTSYDVSTQNEVYNP